MEEPNQGGVEELKKVLEPKVKTDGPDTLVVPSTPDVSGENPDLSDHRSKLFLDHPKGSVKVHHLEPQVAENLRKLNILQNGVSPFMLTVLDDLTADAARTTLLAEKNTQIQSINGDTAIADFRGTLVVDCTTGAGLLTVTLPTLADNQLSRIIVVKDKDSGAGEIAIDAEGAEVLIYPGFTTFVGYIGLNGQITEFVALPDGWHFVSGTIQPVAGEPSLGTPHDASYVNRTSSMLVSTSTTPAATWSVAVTMTYAPAGARAGYCMMYRTGVANPDALVVAMASGMTLDTAAGFQYKYPGIHFEIGGSWSGMVWIPIDDNKQFKWCTLGGNSLIHIGSPVSYLT